MYDTEMVIVGNVVDDPRLRTTKNQHSVANFRVASTSRRFNREQGQFVDDSTLFVNVSCWRSLAENACASLRKGQPVIVKGRFYQREYELNEAKRIRYELEATAIGHDLTRGTTLFSRASRPPMAGTIAAEASGAPVDDADEYLDSLNRDDDDFAAAFPSDLDGSTAATERELVTA